MNHRRGPRSGSEVCPECRAKISCAFLHAHTAECARWRERRGAPWPKFKYTREAEMYRDDAVEGVDYVGCRVCATCGWDVRFRRMVQHIEIHGLDEATYRSTYPGAPVRLDGTTERRRATTLEKYGVDNVSKSEEVKTRIGDTLEERYGVRQPMLSPEIQARSRAGVQAKYGVDNTFAAPEVQAKIRETNLERRGVENPQQCPEVRAKTVATCQERYGVDSFVESEAFQGKRIETCRERYGTDHHMQSEEGRQRSVEAFQEKYGVDTPFHAPEVQQKTYETNLANHGGVHSQQCPEVLAKARATWLEKYGVDNPSKAPEIIERIREVWTAKYGVPFPPQSLHVYSHGRPNGLEQAVDNLSPENVVYTGNAAYWVRAPGETRSRNPDFVVLTADQVRAWRGGTPLNELRTSAVIEAFGDYWHGPSRTGRDRDAHRGEVESFYARAGIGCLVLWETEVKKRPTETGRRITKFLTAWRHRRVELVTTDIFDLFGV